MLDHKRPLHLNVTTQDAFSFESKFEMVFLDKNIIRFFKAFKRCVTTFLSRERECDENNTGQGNWSIVDRGVIYSFKCNII